MRLIYAFFLLLLALMTSANCQQTAEGWLSDLDPNLVVSWIEKGIALHNQGRYDEAVKALDEAIKRDPNYAYAWNIKGVVLRNQGQSLDDPDIGLDGQDKYDEAMICFDEAMICFDEAIRLDPNLTEARVDKGIALLGQGVALARLGVDGQSEYDEAMKCFDEAIRLDPNNAKVWHQKGVALYKMGRDADAEAAFVRAKELGYEG